MKHNLSGVKVWTCTVFLWLTDQRGPGVAPPPAGKQPLPHRGERVRPEEGTQVQRAHHPLREEGSAPER